ncbi:uncharacterized protein TNCV_3836291 [Trichonephila clavipes]|nr:uncharacterized protein TNCV_3836291 [Trichonephila clavipes]
MITNFFIPELNNHDVQELWFQQGGATCHTARATIDLLKDTFGDRLISRFGPVNWPPRSCDLTPLDYFLWGYVKSLVYADKPQTLDHLEDNIRRVIADIRPQMLEKVIENWTSRLDYIRASRGSSMPEIIFKMVVGYLIKDNTEAPDTCVTAEGLHKALESFQTTLLTVIWDEILQRMDKTRSITRIATFIDNVSEHVDITELEVKLKKIDQLQRKIEELKELLFGLETAKPTKEAEFEEDLYKCETRLDDLELKKNKYENGTFAQTKIPPIILPTFSGKYEQFSNFKSQFDDLIATSEQLTQSQKLYYLNSCLSNEVKEFASTLDTFSSLYEALESRYDNKRLIVDIHVQQILNFKKIERENPKEIREMIDCIKKTYGL